VVVAFLAAVPFFEWTQVPAPLARSLPRVVALVLLVTALFAWLSRSVGTLVLDPALFPRVAGPVLLAAAIVFALAPRTFAVGRTLAPAIVGLVGVAGLDPSPEGYRGTALRFLRGSEHTQFAAHYLVLAVVVTLSLWASAILESGPRWSRRTLATLALSLAAAAALAATGVVGLPMLQPHVERPSPRLRRGHDRPRGRIHARGVRRARGLAPPRARPPDVVAGRRRMAAAVRGIHALRRPPLVEPAGVGFRLGGDSEPQGAEACCHSAAHRPGPRGIGAWFEVARFQPRRWSFGSRRPRSGPGLSSSREALRR
jgi:hypothetical protein